MTSWPGASYLTWAHNFESRLTSIVNMVLYAVPYKGKAVTQLDKLIERIRARPPEASFSDVCRLLEAYGWVFNAKKGVMLISPSQEKGPRPSHW